jgi:predicted N-acyltransferase
MILGQPQFRLEISHQISDINPTEWDRLSGERPFQSHRWYQYGERVMSDCKPTYILLYQQDELVGRASLWLVRNEPLPLSPGITRKIVQSLLYRWPLLICRSPLSFLSGLVLKHDKDPDKMVTLISEKALLVAKQQNASILLFDYLTKENIAHWADSFLTMSVPDPGTIMENHWESMNDYLASGNSKNRKNYKQVIREAENLGIRITRHIHIENIKEALENIHNVELAHGTLQNPWAQNMLENMEMINGVFLAATIDEKLVGCGLLLEDNNTQITSLLGLAENTSYVYFMLLYESLSVAFEHRVRLLRWGSGAYDIKRRLGFELEANNNTAFITTNPVVNFILKKFTGNLT